MGCFESDSQRFFAAALVAELRADKVPAGGKVPVGNETPFDIVHAGMLPGKSAAEDADIAAPYAEAGVTRWLENINPTRGSLDEMRERIRTKSPTI